MVSWSILRNERFGYCLILQVDKGIDTGDIVSFDEYIFPSSCRIPQDYENYAVKKYQSFLDDFISKLKLEKTFKLIPNKITSVPISRNFTQKFMDL